VPPGTPDPVMAQTGTEKKKLPTQGSNFNVPENRLQTQFAISYTSVQAVNIIIDFLGRSNMFTKFEID
jgi:hypothetical protein